MCVPTFERPSFSLAAVCVSLWCYSLVFHPTDWSFLAEEFPRDCTEKLRERGAGICRQRTTRDREIWCLWYLEISMSVFLWFCVSTVLWECHRAVTLVRLSVRLYVSVIFKNVNIELTHKQELCICNWCSLPIDAFNHKELMHTQPVNI